MANQVNLTASSWLDKKVNKFTRTIQTLPLRQYALAVLMVVLLVVKFIFMPWHQKLINHKEQLQQLANSVKSPELMLQQTNKMQQALDDKNQLHEQWLTKFYSGSESQVKVDVVNQLQQTTKEQDMLYLRSRWLRTPTKLIKKYTTVEQLMYTVTIRGEYNQVKALSRNWQNMTPFIKVEEVVYRSAGYEGMVFAEFKLVIYRKKGNDS